MFVMLYHVQQQPLPRREATSFDEHQERSFAIVIEKQNQLHVQALSCMEAHNIKFWTLQTTKHFTLSVLGS